MSVLIDRMKRMNKLVTNISPTLFTALAIKGLLITIAYFWPIDLFKVFLTKGLSLDLIINYAPEVWFALLALVLGTLIIVISIAAASAPNLIDLFVTDARSRLFIWLITLSAAENILLQTANAPGNIFLANLIFINNYLLLPLFSIMAIPYIYYILSYTKISNVIQLTFKENIKAIREITTKLDSQDGIDNNQFVLIETINQLQDLQQFIQFKEPKGSILHRMGESLRLYVHLKKDFPNRYFKLSRAVQEDILFTIMEDEYARIEEKRIFYEDKVLRALGTSYLMLIKDGHYDLASLCGSELLRAGKVAISVNDEEVISLVIVRFNTFLRYGINHGLKSSELRYAYNMVYHYSHFVGMLVSSGKESEVKLCFEYFCFYLNEVIRLSLSDPLFIILVNSLAEKLKGILIAINRNNFQRESQAAMLMMLNKASPMKHQLIIDKKVDISGFRIIQIAICLFYQSMGEEAYCEYMMNTILNDIESLKPLNPVEIVDRDCERLLQEPEEFWEDTNQGNKNMFYSIHKDQIPLFKGKLIAKIINAQKAAKPLSRQLDIDEF